MNKLMLILLFLPASIFANEGVNYYVQKILLKDCATVIKHLRLSKVNIRDGVASYTETYSFKCHNKYILNHEWNYDAVLYRVLLWRDAFASPIVITTKRNTIIYPIDPGDYVMQIEHIDQLGSSYFSEPIDINANF